MSGALYFCEPAFFLAPALVWGDWPARRGGLAVKTYAVKANEIKKDWYVVDAEGKTLGRLATQIARVLIGKHKPTFTPHMDVGDFVIVLNADKVVLTGSKATQKEYIRHSRYPGGLKTVSYEEMLQKFPERIIESAVSGMLPKNKLRDVRMRKLKVYTGSTHPHQAQQPRPLPEDL